VTRHAIAIGEYHINIAGTLGDTFFEDQGAFIDHRVHHTLHDLFITDLTRRYAQCLCFSGSNFSYFRIR